jgi:hypothetical protein
MTPSKEHSAKNLPSPINFKKLYKQINNKAATVRWPLCLFTNIRVSKT